MSELRGGATVEVKDVPAQGPAHAPLGGERGSGNERGSDAGNGGGRGTIARIASWMGKPGVGLFLLGAALAFGVLGASDRLGAALRTMRQTNTITVKGVAEMDLTSDRGSWTGKVRARATNLPEAYASLERSSDALRSFVISCGVANDLITAGSVSIARVMKRDANGNETNQLEAYVLTQSLSVNSTDVRVIRQIANDATALIKKGFEVESGEPVFKVSTLEQAKLQLLEQATANAHERAKTLARGSGNSVGKLASASQGVFQILSRGSTSSNDWGGEYDTSAIEKTARVVVTLDYAVE